MTVTDFLFLVFSAVVVASALGVVASRNPVHSALFLVLTFFSCSAVWMLLEAEFLAITLVLVYVGAVMVLFLFVVMMLDINIAKMRQGFVSYLPVGALFALLMVGIMVWVVGPVGPDVMGTPALDNAVRHGPEYSNTEALGKILYTDYVLAFEVAAVILLVAIIAAIALTLRTRPTTKYQEPDKQIQVKRNDRLKIVKMDNDGNEIGRGAQE